MIFRLFSGHLEFVLHYLRKQCLLSNIVKANEKPGLPIFPFLPFFSGLEDNALIQNLLPDCNCCLSHARVLWWCNLFLAIARDAIDSTFLLD